MHQIHQNNYKSVNFTGSLFLTHAESRTLVMRSANLTISGPRSKHRVGRIITQKAISAFLQVNGIDQLTSLTAFERILLLTD
jgi:phage-related baseplate assembly protein